MMKPTAPPVLALASFPGPLGRTPYYCDRLERHVVPPAPTPEAFRQQR